ncbi:hypothetical protein ACVCNH_22355 [Achromobacter anxifer]
MMSLLHLRHLETCGAEVIVSTGKNPVNAAAVHHPSACATFPLGSVVHMHEAMHAFGLGCFRDCLCVEMRRRFEVSINGRRKAWIKGYSSFTLAD